MNAPQTSPQESSEACIQLKLSAEDRESERVLGYFSPNSNSIQRGTEEEEDEDFNNNQQDDEKAISSPSGDSLGLETSRESEQTQTTDSQDDQTTIEVRLLVRRREAGALIGKRGANIKRLREQFRSSIFSIPDTGNGPERVVCVATSERSMGPILEDLTQVLVEKSAENDDQLELKLLIHSSQAGSIIGLGGQSIKKLRNDSKAAIKIYELCCPFSSERVCAIKAKPPVVVRTIKLIQSILHQNPIKGTVKPYDALHFDPMLADKYGGFLPDDGYVDLMIPHASIGTNQFHNLHHHQHHHNLSHHQSYQHQHHHQQYPAHQHRNHFESHHALAPIGFGRPQIQPESMNYPLPPGSNHYSVWRSPELMRDLSPQSCNDISCFAAAAAAAAAAANANPQQARPAGGGSKTQMVNHDTQLRKQAASQCEHLLSMNQLMGPCAATGRFHPYNQVNHHHIGRAVPMRPQHLTGPVGRAGVNIARAFALQAERYRQRQVATNSATVQPNSVQSTTSQVSQDAKSTQSESTTPNERPA